MKKVWIVYIIHNLVNGKIYVGYTGNSFETRWRWHLDNARLGGMQHFACALRLYNESVFYHEILDIVGTKREAKCIEMFYIAALCAYNNEVGYNMTEGGDGSCTEEVCRKISEIKRGCVSPNKNKIWITNGERNSTIYPNLKLPTGFWIGRMNQSQEMKTKTSESVSNLIWITNGNLSQRIHSSEVIPEGFVKGRKPYKFRNKRNPWSIEHRKNLSIRMKQVLSAKREALNAAA